MNARTRLIRTLEGKSTDRVAISTYELCGYNTLAFENNQPSYQPLMDFIRQHTDCVCMWDPASDRVSGLSAYPVKVKETRERAGDFEVRSTTIATPKGSLRQTDKASKKVNTTWHVEPLCKTSSDIDSYLSIPYEPVSYDFSDLNRIKNEVGDQGILMSSIADPICVAMELMDFGEAMVWALTEEKHFADTITELHRRTMENLKRQLRGGVVDLYRIVGSEYLTPPYLPPRFYRDYALPCMTEIVDLIHQHHSFARVHSHGKIARLLDYFIASGADALDPCEAPPDGDLPLEEIKKKAGGNMTLFGNLQLKLLEHGSTKEVKTAVRQCMKAAKQGGKFVIMPTACPIDFELRKQTEENYKVFIETALEEGSYCMSD